MKVIFVLFSLLFLGAVSLPAQQQRTNPSVESKLKALHQPPDDSTYYHSLFFSIAKLKRMSETAPEKQSFRKVVAHRAALNDEQGDKLEAIAMACEAEVLDKDAEAQQVIAQFRKNQAAAPGLPLREPAILHDLWEQRKAILLKYRDQAHTALGEEAFQRIDAVAHDEDRRVHAH